MFNILLEEGDEDGDDGNDDVSAGNSIRPAVLTSASVPSARHHSGRIRIGSETVSGTVNTQTRFFQTGIDKSKIFEREPEREEQLDPSMPPKFKRHLNDEEVTGSFRSERRNLLEEDSDEEEDFFLRGPTGPRFGGQNDKIRQVQSQVDEVIDVMQENISKVIERGERLDELQDKSESLSDNASAFSSRAKHLHRRMWWKDMKMKMIIALVVVILLLIIIIPVILRYR
uniref:Vesicle-associated membrane protein 4 n=2 Tax=Cyprinus carpio TaxID=7962 RepID=A0A9J8BKT3_CYPCA